MDLFITPEAHAKIMACVKECSNELNGIGRIVPLNEEQNKWLIDEVQVLKQEVGAAHAEHDTEDLMNFLAAREDASSWRVQWHSHVNMQVFWSGQDQSAVEAIGETADWFVSLVFNKRSEYKARLDVFRVESTMPTFLRPLFDQNKKHLTKDDLVLTIYHHTEDYSEWAKAEIAEKVKTRPVITAVPKKNGEVLQYRIPAGSTGGAQGEETEEEVQRFPWSTASESEINDYYDQMNRELDRSYPDKRASKTHGKYWDIVEQKYVSVPIAEIYMMIASHFNLAPEVVRNEFGADEAIEYFEDYMQELKGE